MIARITTALVFAVTVSTSVNGQSRPTYEQLQKRAAQLIPDKQQLRFQEIPWIHDLSEAQKIAKEEKRPIFLWGYGGRARPDNGLEGC
jgi:aspartate-semialdehyde dehydrogenase